MRNPKRLRLLLSVLPFLALAPHARAQMLQISGSQLSTASGGTLQEGTVCFAPVDNQGAAASFRLPTGGQAITKPVCAPVFAGAFNLALPDTSKTYPLNVCFAVSVTDNNDPTDNEMGPGYGCVQPSTLASAASWCTTSTTCNFDLYPPNLPALPLSQGGPSITNTFTSQEFVDLNTFPGGDYGAKIAAAEASGQFPGPVQYAILKPGAISTTATLGNQHSLSIFAPTTWNTYLTPTTGNTVQCFGGAASTISNGMSGSSPNSDGVNAFLWAGPSAAEVEHLTVRDCTFNGYGAHSGYIFASDGATQDVSILDNDAIYATLYFQNSASPSNPTTRLTVRGNTCDWTGSVHNPTAACVLSYGANNHPIVEANHFIAPYYGAEFYAHTASGADGSTFPSEADLQSSGLNDGIIAGNDCANVIACAWTSMSNRFQMTANLANICADVCFDFEAGTYNVGSANTASFATNGAFAEEYGGWHNTWVGNVVHGGQGFLITSPTTATSILANKYDSQGIGVFFYAENTAHNVVVQGNQVKDGVFAYAVTYSSAQTIDGNTLVFDAAIPTSNVGNPNGSGCGITLGNFQDLSFANATNNTVITTVSQPVAALCGGLSQDNNAETMRFVNNVVIGPWAADVSVNSSSTNSAVVHQFVIQGITFGSGKVLGSGSAPINVTCKGGSLNPSYSFNGGTTSTLTCN